MKILFIADNFPPESNAPANRIWAHCKRWVQAGEEVTVITSAPNFPTGRVFEGYRNRLYRRETIEGINVIRVWSFITPNQGYVKRTLDFLSFAVSSFMAGLLQSADIIITSSPQFFVGLSARALALAKRKPWVFEVRDLWPESIVAVGMLRKGAVYRILEKLELYFYRSANAVIIVSEGFRKSLVDRGIASGKIYTIPNGADLEEFVPSFRNEALAAKLGIRDHFVIGYIGTLGLAHGLDFVLDCSTALASENIYVLFVGDGAKKAELAARVQAEKIKNVAFVDSVPRKDVPAFMALCDAVLVNLKASSTFATVIPSKIFEAAALRCPILIGVDGVARSIVESYNAGLFYQPENRDAFLAAAFSLKSDRTLYTRLQLGCGALANAYDRNELADQALKLLRRCARSPDAGGNH